MPAPSGDTALASSRPGSTRPKVAGPWVGAIVVVTFAFGAIVNGAIELGTARANEFALRTHGSPDLADLVATEGRTLRLDHWVPAILLEVAHGAKLVVPAGEAIDDLQITYIAQMDLIVEDYDPAMSDADLAALEPARKITSEARLNQGGPEFDIVVLLAEGSLGSTDTVRLHRHDDTVVFVDSRLLDEP